MKFRGPGSVPSRPGPLTGPLGIGTIFSTVERHSVTGVRHVRRARVEVEGSFASDTLSRITSGSIDRLSGVFRRESEMSGPPGHASAAPTTTAPSFSRETVDPVTVKGALGAYGSGTPRRRYAHFAASTRRPVEGCGDLVESLHVPRAVAPPLTRRVEKGRLDVREGELFRADAESPGGGSSRAGQPGGIHLQVFHASPSSNLHSRGRQAARRKDSVRSRHRAHGSNRPHGFRIPSSVAIQAYTSSSAMRAAPLGWRSPGFSRDSAGRSARRRRTRPRFPEILTAKEAPS